MDLIPGNIYVRKEVHDEYGGSRYSGITPTRKTQSHSEFGPMSQARITVIKMAGARDKNIYYDTGAGLRGDQE